MSLLVIDVTPLAINRTAMYFIVRDTVRYLMKKHHRIELWAAGQMVDLAVFVANDYVLPSSFDEKVKRLIDTALTNPNKFVQSGTTKSASAEDRVNLVFDPLYLLFLKPAVRTVAYVLDLTPITRPAWHHSSVSQLYKIAYERLYDPSINIISISESTTRDLWANYGIPKSRCTNVLLYDRFDNRPEIARAPRKHFLFVGSLETRKNIAGLIAGFKQAALSARGFELRIVGGDGHGSETIRNSAAATDGVTLLGRLSDSDLEAEYSTCCCLAYPSYWEGFGLPALEALARKIPLLLSDTGALPEVGGEFASYVDPCSTHSIANGLIKMADAFESGHIDDPLADAKRTAWVARFSRENYLRSVSSTLDVKSTPVRVSPDRDSEILTDADAALRIDVPAGTHIGPSNRRRKLQAAILRRGRILPATLQPVPGDSFSLDYLYCLQQERRLALSRAMSLFMSGKITRFPIYAAKVIYELTSLTITNRLVHAMINETVILKLAAQAERPDE